MSIVIHLFYEEDCNIEHEHLIFRTYLFIKQAL